MVGLDNLAGILAPNLCIACGLEGYVLCPNCQETAGEPPQARCAGCRALTEGWKTCKSCKSWLPVYAIYVANNYEGLYEQLVHSFKFEFKRQTAKPMSEMMAQVLPKFDKEILVCPIPTASSRIRGRGFDHAKLLSKELYRLQESKLIQHRTLLARRTNNRQLGASRTERTRQMKSEFSVLNHSEVKGKTILLLDDIMTTGATLAAAATVLKKSGAKRINAVVFAQKS